MFDDERVSTLFYPEGNAYISAWSFKELESIPSSQVLHQENQDEQILLCFLHSPSNNLTYSNATQVTAIPSGAPLCRLFIHHWLEEAAQGDHQLSILGIDPMASRHSKWKAPDKSGANVRTPNVDAALYVCVYIYIYTSSTAQGGGGSFKNRKPIGEIDCCGSRMAERIHWLTERWLELCLLEWLQWLQWSPHPQLLDVVWCTATVVVVVA